MQYSTLPWFQNQVKIWFDLRNGQQALLRRTWECHLHPKTWWFKDSAIHTRYTGVNRTLLCSSESSLGAHTEWTPDGSCLGGNVWKPLRCPVWLPLWVETGSNPGTFPALWSWWIPIYTSPQSPPLEVISHYVITSNTTVLHTYLLTYVPMLLYVGSGAHKYVYSEHTQLGALPWHSVLSYGYATLSGGSCWHQWAPGA